VSPNDKVMQIITFSQQLGWTPAHLEQGAVVLRTGAPTLAAALVEIEKATGTTIADAYPQGRRYLLEGLVGPADTDPVIGFGDRSYFELVTANVQPQVDRLRAVVAAQLSARSRSDSQSPVSADPRVHGHGAAEQYVMAARKVGQALVQAGRLAADPLVELAAPRRPGPTRDTAFSDDEAHAYCGIILRRSTDPERDALIWMMFRTAAPRESEVIGADVAAVKPERPSITLVGKRSKYREIPVSAPLLRATLALRATRPARNPDALYVTADGRRISVKVFASWSRWLHEEAPWAAGHNIRVQYLRATTARLVDERGGAHSLGAALFLGHEVGNELGTIAHYLHSPHRQPWPLRRVIAETAFGPLDRWPDLPENDLLANFVDLGTT
jgi:site-specific recombinase XerC